MIEIQPQQETPVSKGFLEEIGIAVPYDATRFFTQDGHIVFHVSVLDEIGCSIVCREEFEASALTEEQIETLKTANCYGEAGWDIQ